MLQYSYISFVLSSQTIHENMSQRLVEGYLLSIISYRKPNLTNRTDQNIQLPCPVCLTTKFLGSIYFCTMDQGPNAARQQGGGGGEKNNNLLLHTKFPKHCYTHHRPKIRLSRILTSNSISNLLISSVALFSFSSSI